MSTVRRLIVVIIGIILASDDALAQTREADASAWSFSASAYTFILPEGRSYVQPIVAADRGRLHLEARENAEALDTGSEWFGVNFSGGKTLAWEATPILGGVFGRTTGVGLGLEAAVSWRKLELSIESEHVVDTGDLAASFFYNWSELTVTPSGRSSRNSSSGSSWSTRKCTRSRGVMGASAQPSASGMPPKTSG